MLIHRSFAKRLFKLCYLQSLNIFPRSMILTMPFSVDSIAKLFGLSCESFDRIYVLTSFEKILSPDATVTFIVKKILKAIKTFKNAVNRLSTSRYSNRVWGVKILAGRKFSKLQVFQPAVSINFICSFSDDVSIRKLFFVITVKVASGSAVCSCYGKNAHSVGGADWREEMARALVQWLLICARSDGVCADFVFWSSCGISGQQLHFETSSWSSGKCVRFGAGRPAGSYQDLVNWYCSLLSRRTVYGRAAGNSPRTTKKN